MVAMEAQAGSIYMFTSMNTHGSLPNLTSEWRRAIAIRYVKSGAASANLSDNHFGLLQTYARLFPETEAIYQAVGKQLGEFDTSRPESPFRAISRPRSPSTTGTRSACRTRFASVRCSDARSASGSSSLLGLRSINYLEGLPWLDG